MPAQAQCERVRPSGACAALHHEDDLPLDPRAWCRAQVGAWVARRGALPDRFPMNGKALCLMSEDMFAARVPKRGHLLHQEFRRRLAKALLLQELIEKLQAAAAAK